MAKKLRVVARGTTLEFDAAEFFDRYRPGEPPARMALGADIIDSIEVVDVATALKGDGELEAPASEDAGPAVLDTPVPADGAGAEGP